MSDVESTAPFGAPPLRLAHFRPWPPEREERLRRLLAEDPKLSASQIGDRLGGIPRSAVIGKVRRLGLKLPGAREGGARESGARESAFRPGRKTKPGPQARLTPRTRMPYSRFEPSRAKLVRLATVLGQPVPQCDEIMRADEIVVAPERSCSPRLLTLLELDMVEHCRFPLGDVHSDAFRYCGADREHPWPDAPHCYCAACARLAFTRGAPKGAPRGAPRGAVRGDPRGAPRGAP